jgi:hypothetical protein
MRDVESHQRWLLNRDKKKAGVPGFVKASSSLKTE